MSVRLYRGDTRVDAIDPVHRGIAYGDGLFETMRVHGGQVHWWDRHMARLTHGAGRLHMALPDVDFLVSEMQAMCAGQGDAVLKLIVSRGAGDRGYAPTRAAEPDWQLALHVAPAAPAAGIALRWCTTRLARQPLLAGLKHCNRLEQVLARSEWAARDCDDPDADDGLLCDSEGEVMCATSANVFVLQSGRWVTPLLDRCGVAGVCRGWALQAIDAVEARLVRADIEQAGAVFLCNAVRGILPVARLGDRSWPAHPAVDAARRLLGTAHPAFAPEYP